MSKELVNNIKRGSLGNTIALHDFGNAKPSLQKVFDFIFNFFEENNITPTRMSGMKTHGKTVSFKLAKKQHEEINFNVDGFWIGATPPNHSIDSRDAIFESDITIDSRSTFTLCFDDQIVPFQKQTINKLVKDFALIFDAKYGYAYQRLFDLGPSNYPYGVITGLDWDKDRKERELITKWSHKFRMPDGSYKTGDLRDIYPMNLLVDAHLNRRVVHNQTLEAWIKSDKKHGELEELTPGKFAWWVEQENIPMVREALRPSGIIIAG